MRKINMILFGFAAVMTVGLIAGLITQNQEVVSSGVSVMKTTEEYITGGMATGAGMAAIVLLAVGYLFTRAKHKRIEKKKTYHKVVEHDLRGYELLGSVFAYSTALYSIVIAMVLMFAW